MTIVGDDAREDACCGRPGETAATSRTGRRMTGCRCRDDRRRMRSCGRPCRDGRRPQRRPEEEDKGMKEKYSVILNGVEKFRPGPPFVSRQTNFI